MRIFQHDEQNTVDNQRDGDDNRAVQQVMNEIIEQDADNTGGNAGNDDLFPQRPGLTLLLFVFVLGKWV